MVDVFLKMAFYVALGVVWRFWQPTGLSHESVRHAITAVVYHMLLPLLVLRVLWGAPQSITSPVIPIVAALGVLAALGLSYGAGRLVRMAPPTHGAVMLASSFPNVTYMGLPVLAATLGDSGASIALQYDLFACTPLLFTVGIALAGSFGAAHEPMRWTALLRAPPLWAGMAALALNSFSVSMPDVLTHWVDPLANSVAPLMLIAVGMSLPWTRTALRLSTPLMIVIVLQLAVVPIIVAALAAGFDLRGTSYIGTVMEAAMPTMLIGLAICDRYRLDTQVYAAAITWTTVVSFVTLPLWLAWLT